MKTKFGELQFTKTDLEQLGENLSRAFVSTSFLAQEIREFIRLIDGAIVEHTDDETVALMMTSQRSTLFRILSLKVDSFLQIWEHLLSKPDLIAGDRHEILCDLHTKFGAGFSALKDHPGFKTAKHIRDRMAAHTDLVSVTKSISVTESHWNFSCLLHPDPFNSVYLFGEDIVFGAGLQHDVGRKGSPPAESVDPSGGIERFTSWQEFVKQGAHLCLEYNMDLIQGVSQRCFRKSRLPWLEVEIPENRHSKLEEFRLPLYSDRPVQS